MRRLVLILAALAGLVLLTLGAAVLWLVNTDLRPQIEREAGAALDRQLTVGSLAISWRNPLRLELADVRIANMPGGSEPDMMRFGKVLAEIHLPSLLRGVMRYERLHLEQPMILLERREDGTRNWQFPGGGGPAPRGGLAAVPKNRTQFPTLIDLAVANGLLIYRSEGRKDVRLDFRSVTVRATGDDAPATLEIDGAYNGAPVHLSGTTESFARMRDDSEPFGTRLTMTAPGGTLVFDGTMVEPTDFEGVQGPLRLEAQNLGQFLLLFGVAMEAAFPLQADGRFGKQGERWTLKGTQGQVAGNAFTGEVTLDEGARGQPDAIVTALTVPRLDLATLLGKPKDDSGGPEAIILRPDAKPGAIVDAHLKVGQLIYETIRLANIDAQLRTRPDEVLLQRLSLGAAEGRIEASGSLRTVSGGGRLQARARAEHADVAGLVRLLGGDDTPLTGRLEMVSVVEMTGETLADGFKASRGQAVLSLRDGQLSRDLLEKAMVDLRVLFRPGQGWVPLECAFGIIDLKDGFARLAPPWRLRTPQATVLAAGFVDVPSAQLDLVMRADSDAAIITALKLPIKIAGPVADPKIGPAFGPLVERLAQPDTAMPSWMAPELQRLAEQSACPR